jgi:hypothetical protein
VPRLLALITLANATTQSDGTVRCAQLTLVARTLAVISPDRSPSSGLSRPVRTSEFGSLTQSILKQHRRGADTRGSRIAVQVRDPP